MAYKSLPVFKVLLVDCMWSKPPYDKIYTPHNVFSPEKRGVAKHPLKKLSHILPINLLPLLPPRHLLHRPDNMQPSFLDRSSIRNPRRI